MEKQKGCNLENVARERDRIGGFHISVFIMLIWTSIALLGLSIMMLTISCHKDD